MEVIQLLRIKILYIPCSFRTFATNKKHRFMDHFEQQDIFIAKMKEDYERGVLASKPLHHTSVGSLMTKPRTRVEVRYGKCMMQFKKN